MTNVLIDPDAELALYWVVDCLSVNAPSKLHRRAPIPNLIVFHTAVCAIGHGVGRTCVLCCPYRLFTPCLPFFSKQCIRMLINCAKQGRVVL